MCFHAEVRVDDDSEGVGTTSRKNNANVFANAASVLSMVAEEVQLDDNLEKELANEVELWRMETSSAPTVTMKTHHRKDEHEVKGLSALTVTSGHDRPLLVPFDNRTSRDRSISPPLRTQVSLHNRVGGGVGLNAIGTPRLRAGAKIADELPRRPNGSENRDRLEAATPLRQRGGGVEVKEEHTSRQPIDKNRLDRTPEQGTGARSLVETSEHSDSGKAVSGNDGMSVPACMTCSGDADATGEAGIDGSTANIECDVVEVSIPSLSAREVAPKLSQVKSPEKVPAPNGSSPSPERSVATGNGLDNIQVRGFDDRQEAYANDGLAEGPPDPSADDREVDAFSSSDESAFLGFIEDPLEQERASEHFWGGSHEGPFSSRLVEPDQFAVRPDRPFFF